MAPRSWIGAAFPADSARQPPPDAVNRHGDHRERRNRPLTTKAPGPTSNSPRFPPVPYRRPMLRSGPGTSHCLARSMYAQLRRGQFVPPLRAGILGVTACTESNRRGLNAMAPTRGDLRSSGGKSSGSMRTAPKATIVSSVPKKRQRKLRLQWIRQRRKAVE